MVSVEATHSFEMDVNYLRDDLMQKFRAKTAAEAAIKKRHESAQF